MRKYLFLLYSVFAFFQLFGADFKEKLQFAEDLRKACLFDASIKVLEELLLEKDAEFLLKHMAKKSLSKAYFQNENYENVIEVIDNEEDDEDLILLKAMAFNQLEKHTEAALALLKTAVTKDPQIYEMAIAKFYLKEFSDAKSLFSSLLNSKIENFAALAEMYLVRIELADQEFEKAARNLKNLLKKLPDAHPLSLQASYLQGKLFLSRHEYQKAAHAFQKALLKKEEGFLSWQQPVFSLLDKSLQKAEKQEANSSKDLYIKGLDEFKEGQRLNLAGQKSQAAQAFFKASLFFNQAKKITQNKKIEAFSLKYEAKSLIEQKNRESEIKALQILTALIEETPDLLKLLKNPAEVLYLRAWLFFKADEEGSEKCRQFIELALGFPDSKYADLSLDLLGSFYYRTKNFEKSAEIFLSLEKKYQAEQLLSEAAKALYKAALSLSSLPMQEEGARALRVRLYTEYPDSEYAAKSYFFCYSFQEYLEGNPAAIKHVKNFLKRFSKTPLLIDACYLLGLDSKRDRKTSEGRWISKKNLSLAIHYFQKAENYFEEFLAEDLLEEESTHYLTMRYLSAFERAFSNFKIAEDSSSFGKKEIYLEYARSAFLRICQDFNDPENLLVKMEPYPHLLEESSYYLGMTYLKAGQELLAKETFLEMVNRYQTLAVTRGYFLSKALYELGMIAMSEKEPSLAIEFLLRAEDAAKGKILNSEERLDLWIQQGLCFLELLQFDSAILLFSKAVNDEAVSQARLKAMFLRAFAYEEQGRKELSKKQLEALAKKGGEWGLKAKLKLGRVIN